MSLLFKADSIPLSEHTDRASQWWLEQASRIPIRAAFAEKRRHLATFASHRRSERQRDREVYLTISAIVDDYGDGKCPAAAGSLCGIYEQRPLTCRTVPLHYSRPPSVLQSYIDKFTATPGYECDTVDSAIVLNGNMIVSPDLRQSRERAFEMAKADRRWKSEILQLMGDPGAADRASLPTYEAVLENSDKGYATLLPMIVAWRVAEAAGLISAAELAGIATKQAKLIKSELRRSPLAEELREVLPLYEAAAAEIRGDGPRSV